MERRERREGQQKQQQVPCRSSEGGSKLLEGSVRLSGPKVKVTRDGNTGTVAPPWEARNLTFPSLHSAQFPSPDRLFGPLRYRQDDDGILQQTTDTDIINTRRDKSGRCPDDKENPITYRS